MAETQIPQELHSAFEAYAQDKSNFEAFTGDEELVNINADQGLIVSSQQYLVLRRFYGHRIVEGKPYFFPTAELGIGTLGSLPRFANSVKFFSIEGTDPKTVNRRTQRFHYTWPPSPLQDGEAELQHSLGKENIVLDFDLEGKPDLVSVYNSETTHRVVDDLKKRPPARFVQSIQSDNWGYRMLWNERFYSYIFLGNAGFSTRVVIPTKISPREIFGKIVKGELVEDPYSLETVHDTWRQADLQNSVGIKIEPIHIPYVKPESTDFSRLTELVEQEEQEWALWEEI